MMSDAEFLDRCHAYFDGTLNAAEEAQLFLALRTRPEAQETFTALEYIHKQLSSMPQREPSPAFESRLKAAIAAEGPMTVSSGKVIPLRRGWFAPVQTRAAAAILMVAVVGGWLGLHQQDMLQDNQADTGVASVHPLHHLRVTYSPQPRLAAVPENLGSPFSEKLQTASGANDIGTAASSTAIVADAAGSLNSDARLEHDLEQTWLGLDEINHQTLSMEDDLRVPGNSEPMTDIIED